MPIPENAQAIYSFLTGHGYSANAAAGIAGNIEQESGGNPRAGTNPPGAGLIQELGDPGGSLASELNVILTYDDAQGQALIAQLNSQPTPQAAALFYSQMFERPNAGLANNSNREQSAQEVAAAAASGNWAPGAPTTTTTAASGNIIPGWLQGIFNLVPGGKGVNELGGLLDPANWIDWLERGALMLFGGILILVGIHSLTKSAESKQQQQAPAVNIKNEEGEVGEAEIVAA
jgi:hypothetical protein